MSDYSIASTIPSLPAELSNTVAVVGVGETDYGADYRASRAHPPDYVPPTAESLGAQAFARALADSGLEPGDIDGLCTSFLYGGPAPADFAAAVGITPSYAVPANGMMPFLSGVEAIASGRCETIALVHAIPSRAQARQYGGQTYGGDGRDSYYYYHPWGWSSQAAHWATMFTNYRETYGATEADLASVAITHRDNAALNDNAIMRSPLTVDAYLSSRYIVRPMHLFDMCLVNDGAVCLILRKTERSSGLAHVPIMVSGWGNAHASQDKLRVMIEERLRPQLQQAGADALSIAKLTVADIDHLEAYDAATIHVINQLEGYGFVAPGEGIEFVKAGHTAIKGSLPTNTSGGMLSEAYLQGWNLIVESVRQLRHEAGERQSGDIETAMFSFATTDSAHPIVFRRGD
jgi:acetyl-CoA acetyltransferase